MPKIVAENGKDVLEILKLYNIEPDLAPSIANTLRKGGTVTIPLQYPGNHDWGLSLTITPPSKVAKARDKARERRAYWSGKRGDKKRKEIA